MKVRANARPLHAASSSVVVDDEVDLVISIDSDSMRDHERNGYTNIIDGNHFELFIRFVFINGDSARVQVQRLRVDFRKILLLTSRGMLAGQHSAVGCHVLLSTHVGCGGEATSVAHTSFAITADTS